MLNVLLQDSQPAPGGTPADSGATGFGGFSMLPLILIFAIFYFVMIGPERKKRKQREAMLAELKKGDKIMTSGGMLAAVANVADDVVTLQIADGVRVRYSRQSIQTVISDDPPSGKDDKKKG